MANDCVMLEGSKVGGDEERDNGNGIELSLELSIGGSYAKSKKMMASGVKGDGDSEETGRSSGEFGVCVDLQAKREIQALRRQEARRKREGKVKRVIWKETNSYDSSTGSGGGVNIGQDGDSRVRVRDNVDGIMEPASKRGKNGNGIVGKNHGSIPVDSAQFTNGFVNFYGGMRCLGAMGRNEVNFQPTGGRSFQRYQGNGNSEKCGKEGWPANASLSPGRSSLTFSDYQNSNVLGGNTSDNGSNSTYTQAKMQQQQKNVAAPSDPPEQSDHSGSSKQTESNPAAHSSANSLANIPQPNEEPKSDTDQSSSPLITYPILTSINTNQGPLKVMSEADTSRPPPQPKMPCVTTTGNGPNGKTITGFLYRYNKNEVSIVCVCHGSSFSPAGFVEHAGGIDITHPLRHITVIPSAFG